MGDGGAELAKHSHESRVARRLISDILLVDIDKLVLKPLRLGVLDRGLLVQIGLDNIEKFVGEREGIESDMSIDGFEQLLVRPCAS